MSDWQLVDYLIEFLYYYTIDHQFKSPFEHDLKSYQLYAIVVPHDSSLVFRFILKLGRFGFEFSFFGFPIGSIISFLIVTKDGTEFI